MDSTHLPFRFALVAIAAPLLALGCTKAEKDPQSQPVEANLVQAEPVLPKPQAPLNREGLIVATLRAMTAAALGQNDAAAQSGLKGKRFELRIRFGCPGRDPKAPGGWSYDEAKGVLRARVQADVGTEKMQAGGLLGEGYEGAVGFTLPRPWMLTDGCPDPKLASTSAGPAISVVQLFTGSDSRVQRPEASYEAVTPVAPEEVPVKGLTLILSGRLEPLSDGRAIRCVVSDGPPACMISSVIDRVAIVDPERDTALGEWGTS